MGNNAPQLPPEAPLTQHDELRGCPVLLMLSPRPIYDLSNLVPVQLQSSLPA